jgi:hypothetical protein
MRDTQDIEQLEVQIAMDKRKNSEIQRLEIDLIQYVPQEDFSAISMGLKYRGKLGAFEASILMGEETLAREKSAQ